MEPPADRSPTLLLARANGAARLVDRRAGDRALLELLLWCALHDDASLLLLRRGRARRLRLDRPGGVRLG